MKEENAVSITLEAVDAGDNLPPWFIDALANGVADELLILHPNEASRNQTLLRLAQSNCSADTTHHLTTARLLQLLILDLGLPPLFGSDAGFFTVVHAHVKQAAENGELPLLFSAIEGRKWSSYHTERILSLHRTLHQLNNPWSWEGDPGAKEFDTLLCELEEQLGGTHPHHAFARVIDALKSSSECPFTLNDVRGIIVLDSAPDYSEIERSFFAEISKKRPIHQLSSVGSFRLGFHGAYLFDAEWDYTTSENLPDWVPQHEVWSPPNEIHWQSRRGKQRNTSHHRITLERGAHSMEAAVELLRSYGINGTGGRVLIIDGAADAMQDQWHSRLESLGYHCGNEQKTLEQIPAVAGLARAMKLGNGMDAWSLHRLRGLYEYQSLPLENGAVEELSHPSEPLWKPRPHSDILENIARSFHVRGGHGSLLRWLGTLAQATPQLGENVERARQALEETQWWLHCIAEIWAPLLDQETLSRLPSNPVGCSTQRPLPLPSRLDSGVEWLDRMYRHIDWNELSNRTAKHDRSLAGLQIIRESHESTKTLLEKAGYSIPETGQSFIEYFERLLAQTSLPRSRSRGKDIQILTPEQAHGVEADLILLVGLDVNSWSMKTSKVPWLDAPAQIQLGLYNSDLAIRRGRHHLRHLLNAAQEVIFFDTSAEEGGGPSAPLSEWLTETRHEGTLTSFQSAPSFLSDSEHQEGQRHRAWHWTIDEYGGSSVWLTPRPFTMTMIDRKTIGERAGHRGRDERQRLGLALLEGSTPNGTVLSSTALAMAHELQIQTDRSLRQPMMKDLENGTYFTWNNREHLVSADDLVLQPSASQVSIGSSQQKQWPHLGLKRNSKFKGPAIDPRPLPALNLKSSILNATFGFKSTGTTRNTWSQSRLQSWLKCPRMAWMDKQLKAEPEDVQSEDVDSRARGTMIHDAEAAMLNAHGVITAADAVENPLPLHQGPMKSIPELWGSVLSYLGTEVPWLARNDAVAVHRCREMLGVTPREWRMHLEGEIDLEPSGRLGRMVSADFELMESAPLACEWMFSEGKTEHVQIDGQDDGGKTIQINLSGRVDRVDAVILSQEQQIQARADGILAKDVISEALPHQFENPQPANRLVIIRDLKTVNGPKSSDKGNRHRKGLFDEVQLGLYARAWEKSHPGDRVVGVGVTEIGESTTHYVELDASILQYIEGCQLGERTAYTQTHHRTPGSEFSYQNGFRAWISERIRTAGRAIETAQQGHVNATPGKHCSYCSVRQICPSAPLGGDVQ
ncbi:MAG: hypothetical protein HOJ60_04695 [Euryarchaeota archaeon]|jgi:hypothetical protein|nr:hypothetical protein [Euryarchaeota archaeon]